MYNEQTKRSVKSVRTRCSVPAEVVQHSGRDLHSFCFHVGGKHRDISEQTGATALRTAAPSARAPQVSPRPTLDTPNHLEILKTSLLAHPPRTGGILLLLPRLLLLLLLCGLIQILMCIPPPIVQEHVDHSLK